MRLFLLVRRLRSAACGALIVVHLIAPRAAAENAGVRQNATAAAPGQAPPVDELVAQAIANAPSVAARKARLAAAAAAAKAAGALVDPMLEFEIRDGGFPRWTLGENPMSMVGVGIRQPLLTGGRREASRAAAAADIDVRSAEADALISELTAAVRTAYSRVYAIDRERAVLRDAAEMARLLVATATARYGSGSSDQTAVLRAQLEQTRLAERAADVEADRATVVVSLNRLLNLAPDAPLGEVGTLPEPKPSLSPPGGLPDVAASIAPGVSVREAEVNAAAFRVAVLKEDLRPNWTVGGSFFWQGGTDRIVSVTVGVDWPWRKDRRQLPLVAASERELDARKLDLADTAADVRAEAARLAVEVKRAEDQITRYREGLLPQSSAALNAAREGYLGDRGDFASVLDEFRRWTEIRIGLARREAGRFAAWAQLDALVTPPRPPATGTGSQGITKPSKEPRP